MMDKCKEHGRNVIGSYAAGKSPQSAALTIRRADKNLRLQVEAKMAECIFAIERGLDPLKVLNWTGKAELDGVDVTVNDVRVDVKQTQPGNRLLIWSAGKQGKLEGKKSDVLVLVTCRGEDYGGESKGWISRGDFISKRHIAPPPAYLDEGTHFLDVDELNSMEAFPKKRLLIKPNSVAGSTWDAFIWLRKYHPERLSEWLVRHSEIPKNSV